MVRVTDEEVVRWFCDRAAGLQHDREYVDMLVKDRLVPVAESSVSPVPGLGLGEFEREVPDPYWKGNVYGLYRLPAEIGSVVTRVSTGGVWVFIRTSNQETPWDVYYGAFEAGGVRDEDSHEALAFAAMRPEVGA